MAPPAGRIRPGRYLGIFVLIVVVLYLLVFFTGDRKPAPKLGIDLQGGTTVTLTPKLIENGQEQALDKTTLDQARQTIERRVNGIGVSGAQVVTQGSNIIITVPGANGDEAKKLGQNAQLNFRQVLDSQQATAPPTPPAPGGETLTAAQLQQLRGTRQAADLVTGTGNAGTAGGTAQQALSAFTCATQDPLQGNDDPKLPLLACSQDGATKYLLGPVFLAGDQIDTAVSSPPAQNKPGWTVDLTFKSTGRQTWADFTTQNVGKQAAFVLDTQVVSAPTIQNAIVDGNTQITGNFTQQQTKDLADTLKYGSLPVSFQTSNAQTISPTLGLASLRAGLIAGSIGLALVFVYCLFYYRLLGVLTIVSLALSSCVVYAVLVLLGRAIGFTLDLPGIAGFIISIGVTADSFVVFFERLKDEIREGRTFRSAVPRGWVRARRTILASDAILFLASAVLYLIAVGDVQGFAFTLGVSTVLDLVIVFLVTHPLVVLVSQSKTLSRPRLTGLGGVQHLAAERKTARKAATAAKEA
ncbi:MAG TPA: protein translocase subunit SecD [Amycolatopsis sp.]|nr:protein translocase subunit SecD [Amycolatopsis sp.]